MKKLINEIDELLYKRQEVYPIRNEIYENLNNKIEAFAKGILLEISNTYKNWNPDIELTNNVDYFINKPVFICGSMKSGTSMLTQLFDSHNDIVVMPGDSHYFSKFYNKKWTLDDLMIYWLKRLVNVSGKEPFWYLGKSIENYLKFGLYLKYFISTNGYEVFQSVVAALYCSNINRAKTPKIWIEKTPGNEQYIDELKNRFNNAKFIHIIRNPLINIASLKKLSKYRNQEFDITFQSKYLKFLISKSFINLESNSNYIVFKYEDIVNDLKTTMTKVANFLNINFEESLLIPTENGIPGKANSMYSESRKSGAVVKDGINNRWKEELTEYEKKIIINTLYHAAIDLGYDNWKNKEIKKYLIKQSLFNRLINKILK